MLLSHNLQVAEREAPIGLPSDRFSREISFPMLPGSSRRP